MSDRRTQEPADHERQPRGSSKRLFDLLASRDAADVDRLYRERYADEHGIPARDVDAHAHAAAHETVRRYLRVWDHLRAVTTAPMLARPRTATRRRGAGRPASRRTCSRSSRASSDDDPGEADQPHAAPRLGVAA